MLVLQDVAPAGTMVHKGDQVAEFDRQYMLLRLDDYKASVIQSEASLKTRKANLDISHKSHEQLVNAANGALEKARLDLKTIPAVADGGPLVLASEDFAIRGTSLSRRSPLCLRVFI